MKNSKLVLQFAILLLILEFIIFQDLPFFWDARSKFIRASWLFDNNFEQWVVPTEINSGHPPLWLWILSVFWALLGKTIIVARLALLIINIGVFCQLYYLGKYNFPKQAPLYLIFLLFLEPTLLAQTTNLGNDMLLLFFVLLGLNALQKNRFILYTLAISGLLLTNLRGLYCVLALIIIHYVAVRYKLIASHKKMRRSYLIGILPLFIFLIYQYQILGWVLFPQDNSYTSHRQAGSIGDTIRNSAAYLKMLLEFGRFFVWIPLTYFMYKWIKNKNYTNNIGYITVALWVFVIIFFLGFVPFSNPLGPRYLMIIYALATLLSIIGAFQFIKKRINRNILLSSIFIGFLTGHLWIYPVTIAQGWDSTLAYIPYFGLQDQMIEFMHDEGIALEEVSTNLRINYYLKRSEVLDEEISQLHFGETPYFIFSNIENKTTDMQIQELVKSWKKIQHYEKMGIFITLYLKPDY